MRRAVVYFFFDPRGQVDDYVLHALSHVRPHAELVFVVSNSALDSEGRARLGTHADQILERANTGLDVWAYKEAMEEIGADRLAEFDEVVLMNSTYFGPIRTFDDLFADMDARGDLDFWGITEHGPAPKQPFERDEPLLPHLQSHWIAVRQHMLTSAAWRDYWDGMPEIETYQDSVLMHEIRFTGHFERLGFTSAAAYPSADYDNPHPVLNNAVQMVRDGCPIVKRRTFFHSPTSNEHFAVDGRQLLRVMEQGGYPVEMALTNLARTSKPRALATNLGLLEILPEVDLGYDHANPLRVVAVAHIFYPDMTDEIVDRLDFLPGTYDLVVTTSTEEDRQQILDVLAGRGRAADVRVVKSNRGRDVSAFFVDCRDVLESDDYDVVVKLHSKKNLQDPRNVAELFKRHLFENLLSSPGYAANVLRLFQQHPSLGMVFPPVYHIAYPTLGHAWFHNKARARQEADRLGIDVPFDDTTPLSAYGSMYVARTATLRALTSAGYTHDDFPDESGYGDGALSHVVERLVSYAVLSTGHHVREVMNADLAAVNYRFLEHRAVAIGGLLPAYLVSQIKKIKRMKRQRQMGKSSASRRPAVADATPSPRRFRRLGATRARGRRDGGER